MAELKVPETQAKDVAVGQLVAVDTRNGVVEGKVIRVDPAASGWQSYEATRFLERRPAIEPRAALVLWQAGVVGSVEHTAEPAAPRLTELVDALLAVYPAAHEVVVYEASGYPGVAPLVQRVALRDLEPAVTGASTLYVPPLAP